MLCFRQKDDHETRVRTTLQPHAHTFDISWARNHIRDFRKIESETKNRIAEEQRYRDRPGYIPAQPETDITAAARRAYEKDVEHLERDTPQIRLRSWDDLPKYLKLRWEDIARAAIG